MHMKRNYLLLLLSVLSINAHALIVSINGLGDIPAEGLDTTLTQATVDLLSGETVMKLEGSLLATEPLTVTITRSVAGLSDEFCCAGQCTSGNAETQETLLFTPAGMASWYIHYMPMPGSDVQLTYTFSAGGEERQLRVRYAYQAEGIDTVRPTDCVRKILRDGHLYIVQPNNTLQIL